MSSYVQSIFIYGQIQDQEPNEIDPKHCNYYTTFIAYHCVILNFSPRTNQS